MVSLINNDKSDSLFYTELVILYTPMGCRTYYDFIKRL